MKEKIKKVIRSLISLLKEKQLISVPTPVNTNCILEGKVALIIGGSGGIGFAMARAFLNSGCKVIIAGTQENKLKKCCEIIGGGYIRSLVINVLDVHSLPDKVHEAAALFEENRIDILVNSAGVIDHAGFLDVTEAVYDSVMNINVKGTFFMSQAVGHYMVDNGIKGHILNVSSASALRPAWSPYRMSKWTIRGLTLGMAESLLPHGIIVNAIGPGSVATEMLGRGEEDNLYLKDQPSGRYATPNEIANLAVFMVSDMGNLIVGDTFYMTGGSGTISIHH